MNAPEELNNQITENLLLTRQNIENAAKKAEQNPLNIDLVAVSKTHSVDVIEPVIHAGQRIFGENRIQEAATKWPGLKEKYSDIELHLIGPLQTNKVRQALELFDVIETVDRPKLAATLARVMEETGHRPDCYIQINTGEESQKAGVVPMQADEFISQCREQHKLPIIGLMCIPPADEQASLHFGLLREIARRNGIDKLSMGMSSDYELAVRFGATSVRVGSAIFGARKPYPPVS